jgi:hypothetical protein
MARTARGVFEWARAELRVVTFAGQQLLCSSIHVQRQTLA